MENASQANEPQGPPCLSLGASASYTAVLAYNSAAFLLPNLNPYRSTASVRSVVSLAQDLVSGGCQNGGE